MQVKTAIYDAAIELGLDLERVAADVSRNVLESIVILEDQLRLLALRGALNNKQVLEQIREAKAYIEEAYATALAASSGALTTVAVATSSSYSTAIAISIGNETAGRPTRNQLEAIAKNVVVDGVAHGAWWSRQQADTAFNFERIIRHGMINQRSGADIAYDVQQQMQITKRNADALVRTSINSVSTEAQLQTVDANQDVVKAFQWDATLDARTCIRCGALDGKRWDSETKEPIGHSQAFIKPPLHFNDRCRIVPITKTFRELGIDMDELDAGRASDAGYTDAKTFEQFLERKGQAYQDKVLGVGRAKLWRDGKLTFNQLVDGRGNPLSLAELSEKYG